jgi:hypothetical protein
MLMGALSADIPSVFLPAGPMLNAHWRDTTLGSGTDAWKYWAERCAGNLCDGEWKEIENCIARSAGTCMTMGTASTMACIAEALGMTLPGASSIPAVVAEHSRLAVATGRLAVELAWTDRKPSRLLSAGSFVNAMITQLAIGGSTNAIVHLIAMAGRAGLKVTLDDFDAWSRQVPVLANIRPSGKYLMEDFHRAGGLRALWSGLQGLLDHYFQDGHQISVVLSRRVFRIKRPGLDHLIDQLRVLAGVLFDVGDQAKEGLELLLRHLAEFVESFLKLLPLLRRQALEGVGDSRGQTRKIPSLKRGLLQCLCKIWVLKEFRTLHGLFP